MDAKHFLQRSKTSFQTFVSLTKPTELTDEIQRILKLIEKGHERFDFMLCQECNEIECECNEDPERMGCDMDQRLPFGDPTINEDGIPYD
jgi:hypothetical protein